MILKFPQVLPVGAMVGEVVGCEDGEVVGANVGVENTGS